MQLLFDFFPIIVFFVAFKVYDMYVATAAIIVAMAVQISVQWIRKRTVNRMLLVSGLLVALFGGATLVLRNPIFIQWKPTIFNWVLALVGKNLTDEEISSFVTDTPLSGFRVARELTATPRSAAAALHGGQRQRHRDHASGVTRLGRALFGRVALHRDGQADAECVR